MSELLYVGIFVVVVSVAYLAYLLKTAPEGYEDENGFHYGKDPRYNG